MRAGILELEQAVDSHVVYEDGDVQALDLRVDVLEDGQVGGLGEVCLDALNLDFGVCLQNLFFSLFEFFGFLEIEMILKPRLANAMARAFPIPPVEPVTTT